MYQSRRIKHRSLCFQVYLEHRSTNGVRILNIQFRKAISFLKLPLILSKFSHACRILRVHHLFQNFLRKLDAEDNEKIRNNSIVEADMSTVGKSFILFVCFSQQKGNIPLAYIAAHLSKIHGLDWSPGKESCFVTASNDNTVKVCLYF